MKDVIVRKSETGKDIRKFKIQGPSSSLALAKKTFVQDLGRILGVDLTYNNQQNP